MWVYSFIVFYIYYFVFGYSYYCIYVLFTENYFSKEMW